MTRSILQPTQVLPRLGRIKRRLKSGLAARTSRWIGLTHDASGGQASWYGPPLDAAERAWLDAQGWRPEGSGGEGSAVARVLSARAAASPSKWLALYQTATAGGLAPPTQGGGPAGGPVLHPIGLLADRGLRPHLSWATIGYPGTGNMVTQAVLRELDALAAAGAGTGSTVAADPLLAATRGLGLHQSGVINQWTRDVLGEAGLPADPAGGDGATPDRGTYTLGTGNRGEGVARVVFPGRREPVVLRGMPNADWLGNNFGAHMPPERHTLAFLNHFGYRRLYFTVRDPLATFASSAGKTLHAVEALLHDPTWFRRQATNLAKYFRELADLVSVARDIAPDARIRVIRYEDLVGRPTEVIADMAADIGLAPEPAAIAAIWDRVGFKPITAAGREHLRDPRSDKRRHYRPAHLDWLADAGWRPGLAESLGYAFPAAADLTNGPLSEPDAGAGAQPSMLYGNIDTGRLASRFDPATGIAVDARGDAEAESLLEVATAGWRQRLVAEAFGDAFARFGLFVPGNARHYPGSVRSDRCVRL